MQGPYSTATSLYTHVQMPYAMRNLCEDTHRSCNTSRQLCVSQRVINTSTSKSSMCNTRAAWFLATSINTFCHTAGIKSGHTSGGPQRTRRRASCSCFAIRCAGLSFDEVCLGHTQIPASVKRATSRLARLIAGSRYLPESMAGLWLLNT